MKKKKILHCKPNLLGSGYCLIVLLTPLLTININGHGSHESTTALLLQFTTVAMETSKEAYTCFAAVQ